MNRWTCVSMGKGKIYQKSGFNAEENLKKISYSIQNYFKESNL